MTKQRVLTRILDAAIIISMIAALGILIALPFFRGLYTQVADLLLSYPPAEPTYLNTIASLKIPAFSFVVAAVYFTGALYLWIALDARRLTKSILHTTPFAMGNVMALRRIAVLAFLECVIFTASSAALLLMRFSFFMLGITGIVAVASAFVSIIAAVLSQLLRSAIAIKEENDLTI